MSSIFCVKFIDPLRQEMELQLGLHANDFAPRACRAGVAVAGGVAIVIKLNSALKDEGGWVRAM